MPTVATAVMPVIAVDRRRAPKMAKADLRKAETQVWAQAVGHAVQRAVSICGWSLKEFAAAIGREERQCARWITGEERAQLDTMFAVEALRQPLVQALAELADAEVVVTVRLRAVGR